MFRPLNILFLLVLSIATLQPTQSHAWGTKNLASINGQDYSVEDFKHWWASWNEKGALPFPEKPDEFIDFHLLAQQAQAMELDKKPRYLHKIDVYRKVRAMLALKREEVDSQIKIDQAAVKKYFDEHYSPVRLVQILTFADAGLAKQAYETMKPFQGKATGRLIFADLQGGGEETKAERYDELWLSPDDFFRNHKEIWLKIIEQTPINSVSEPHLFEETQRFLLFRVADIKPADSELLSKKEKSIQAEIYKEARNKLTNELISKLIKKYNVTVDKKLLAEIDLDKKYDEDFLEKPIVAMTGATYTVRDLIYNASKERQVRRGIENELIKNLVVNNMISQKLIEMESLSRGYEKKPPGKWDFDFYCQYRLVAELDTQLKEGITVSDDEIESYYDSHLASFSEPEMTTFRMVEGEEEPLKKIWIGALQGGGLDELAKKYDLTTSTKTMAHDQLSSELATVLDKLEKDGVSTPFQYGSGYALVKFLKRTEGRVHSLSEVKNNLKELVKNQKFETLKAEYLGKLKTRSKIEINQSNWQDLVREKIDESKS